MTGGNEAIDNGINLAWDESYYKSFDQPADGSKFKVYKMKEQEVILVNEKDEMVGTMEKMEAHRKALLHRAFSVFLFNKKGEMLLQKRSLQKYHSGGLWTNACCSHPYPGEGVMEAAIRRLKEELGITCSLQQAFAFTYKASFENGLSEFEFDHVFVGEFNGDLSPDPAEVSDFCYLPMDQVRQILSTQPHNFTEWFRIAFSKIETYLSERK